MKLQIKKKYFDMIENGEKNVEFRDAHLTLVCEETGRRLRRDVDFVEIIPRRVVPGYADKSLFTDDRIIAFHLKKDEVDCASETRNELEEMFKELDNRLKDLDRRMREIERFI